MLCKIFIPLVLLLFVISCSSDDEIVRINEPAIDIDVNSFDISFDYEDYIFTALQDSVILDLDVSYSGETGSNELLILWSIDNNTVDSQKGSFNQIYQLQLNDLGKEHYNIEVGITNQNGDFMIEKSVILNNSPYLNLKNPAVGQKTRFNIFDFYGFGDDADSWELLESCEFSDNVFGYEQWEIFDLNDSTFSIKTEFEYSAYWEVIDKDTIVWERSSESVKLTDFEYFRSIMLILHQIPFEVNLGTSAYPNFTTNEGCFLSTSEPKGQYETINHLNKTYNNSLVLNNSGTGSGWETTLLMNQNYEVVGSTTFIDEFTYDLFLTVREEL